MVESILYQSKRTAREMELYVETVTPLERKKLLISRSGETQKSIAQKFGVSPAMITYWINGKRNSDHIEKEFDKFCRERKLI